MRGGQGLLALVGRQRCVLAHAGGGCCGGLSLLGQGLLHGLQRGGQGSHQRLQCRAVRAVGSLLDALRQRLQRLQCQVAGHTTQAVGQRAGRVHVGLRHKGLQGGGGGSVVDQQSRHGGAQQGALAPQAGAAFPVHGGYGGLGGGGHVGHARRGLQCGPARGGGIKLQVQHAGDLAEQAGRLQGLAGKAVHARSAGVAPVLLQHAGGQGDHRHRLAPLRLLERADAARGLQPVHAGHLQVHQHHVKVPGLVGGDSAFSVPCHGDLVAPPVQVDLQQLYVGRHIVHHQHAHLRQLQGLTDVDHGSQGLAHGQRQTDRERGAHPQGAAHADAAAHQLDQLPRDGGAKTCATELPRGGRIGLCKGVEDALQMLRGDADAGVLHLDHQRAVVVVQPQQHMAALGELERVAQQVQQHLLQAQRIAPQVGRYPFSRHALQRQPLLARMDAQRGEDLVAQLL